MKGSFLFIPLCMLVLSLISCKAEPPRQSIDLPPTPVLTSESIWGVANTPYVKVLSEHDNLAEVNGVLRRGDRVQIMSKVGVNGGKQYWYEVKGSHFVGWVPDSRLDVYDSEAQALTASKALTSRFE